MGGARGGRGEVVMRAGWAPARSLTMPILTMSLPDPATPAPGVWSLEELCAAVGVPQDTVRRKLGLWKQQGVLREEAGGRYSVLETSCSRERPERPVMLMDSDEEGDSNTTTQSEQREEKLQVGVIHTYRERKYTHTQTGSTHTHTQETHTHTGSTHTHTQENFTRIDMQTHTVYSRCPSIK